MATQNLIVQPSAYYYMGLSNILDLLQKRKFIIQNLLGEYFPDLKTNWSSVWNDDISPILKNFGTAKIIINAMPDKPTTQGDGSLTPWNMSKTPGDLNIAYILLNNKGITFNINMSIESLLNLNDPSLYQHNSLRMTQVFNIYEKLHELKSTIQTISTSISPVYRSTISLDRSPGQLQVISGNMFNDPYLFDTTGKGNIAVNWDFIDNILLANFNKTYIDNSIFKVDNFVIPTYEIILKSETIILIPDQNEYNINISLSGKYAIACSKYFEITGEKSGETVIINIPIPTYITGTGDIVLPITSSLFDDNSTVTYTTNILYTI